MIVHACAYKETVFRRVRVCAAAYLFIIGVRTLATGAQNMVFAITINANLARMSYKMYTLVKYVHSFFLCFECEEQMLGIERIYN